MSAATAAMAEKEGSNTVVKLLELEEIAYEYIVQLYMDSKTNEK